MKNNTSKRVDFSTTGGILDEIENSANDFLCNGDINTAEVRAKNCDVAIKIHALEHMKERFRTAQAEKRLMVNKLKTDDFGNKY